MTQDVLNEFNENIKRIKSLHAVYEIIKKNTIEILDISDILRAEVVLVVSALDCYIHNLVKVKMIEIFKGNIPETPSFKKFKIPLEEVKSAINNPQSYNWLEDEVMNQHGWKSFQQSKRIEEAIALISEQKIWPEIGKRMGLEPEKVKNKLDLIVDRRNKIAHEADIMPPTYDILDRSIPYEPLRWPIDGKLVEDVINFIEKMVNAIDELI